MKKALAVMSLSFLTPPTAFSKEDLTRLSMTDGSSISLKKGYEFSEVTTISDFAPSKVSATLNGPIFEKNERAKKYVEGQVTVVTFPGISLLEEWNAEDNLDPEEIIFDRIKAEKERMLSHTKEQGFRSEKFSEQWIELLGRKTRFLSFTATLPHGTRMYLRVIVFRARDSFYTIKCLSLGRRPDGWASACIREISDGPAGEEKEASPPSAEKKLPSTPDEYRKAVLAAVEMRWQELIKKNSDFSTAGTLTIQFNVSKEGEVSDAKLLGESENVILTSISMQAVFEAKIDPIPAEVVKALKADSIEVQFRALVR
ncbi:MAG: hypothetical protein AAGJ79_04370 [Verrucomicrobiota bacterium]